MQFDQLRDEHLRWHTCLDININILFYEEEMLLVAAFIIADSQNTRDHFGAVFAQLSERCGLGYDGRPAGFARGTLLVSGRREVYYADIP